MQHARKHACAFHAACMQLALDNVYLTHAAAYMQQTRNLGCNSDHLRTIDQHKWNVVMPYIVMPYVVMVYIVMAYVVMAYVVMAHVVMVYAVMTYVVMAGVPANHQQARMECRRYSTIATLDASSCRPAAAVL